MDPGQLGTFPTLPVRPPALPLTLVELILALAPHSSPVFTTHLALARVLPPSQVPLAYASIFRFSNSDPVREVIPWDEEDDDADNRDLVASNDVYLGLERFIHALDNKSTPRRPDHAMLLRVKSYLCGAYSRGTQVDVLEKQINPSCALVTLSRYFCVMGNIEALGRVIDQGRGDPAFLAHFRHAALTGASQAGNWPMFRMLEAHLTVGGNLRPSELLWCATVAAPLDNYVLLRRLLDRLRHSVLRSYDLFRVVRTSCIAGHAVMFDWFFHRTSFTSMLSEFGWRYSAEHNHRHMLEYLRTHQIPEPTGSTYGWVNWASKNGHFDVLNWFYRHTKRTHYTCEAVEWASEAGRLDVIEWWLSKRDLVFKFSPGAMWQAHRRGHIAVARFWGNYEPYRVLSSFQADLRDESLAVIPRDPVTLASFGRLDLLRDWGFATLFAQPKVPLHGLQRSELSRMLENAALYGHVPILDYFFRPEHRASHTLMWDTADSLVSAALPGDRVNVIQWLLARFPFVDERFDWSSSLPELVSLEARCVLEWLFQTRRCAAPVSTSLVKVACKAGDVAMLNLLLAKGMDVDRLESDDLPLIEAARNGHVRVLSWWVRHGLPMPRSTRPVDYASKAGKRGVLDWWLHESGKPFLWSEAAVRWAVQEKQDHVVQWWLSSQLVKDSDLLTLLRGA